MSCPVCGSDAVDALFCAADVPVFCNVQWETRDRALAAPRATLAIDVCPQCGHAHNAAFREELVGYAPGYDNSQHFSTTFQAYAMGLVDRLVVAHGLNGASIVDIGCGRGDLLTMLVQRNGGRGFGFDPSAAAAAGQPARSVTISRKLFTREDAQEIRPGLVCCRHVLEHVRDPIGFLVEIRKSLETTGTAVLYIEVPNGEQQLRDSAIWDYIYEHYSYFSACSLAMVLEAAGFEILALREDFGGQFLCVEARPARRSEGPLTVGRGTPAASHVAGAAARFRTKLARWREWADETTAAGRCVTIWGAGSKGVMFLNLLGLNAPSPIEYAVDQSRTKHHRYVAVRGQEIVPPERLAGSNVEEIVVMNPVYRGEIERRLGEIGLAPRILIA